MIYKNREKERKKKERQTDRKNEREKEREERKKDRKEEKKRERERKKEREHTAKLKPMVIAFKRLLMNFKNREKERVPETSSSSMQTCHRKEQ